VQIPRIAADPIEELVQDALPAQTPAGSPSSIRRVVISSREVRIDLVVTESADTSASKQPAITIPIRLHRRGQEVEVRPADNTAQAEPSPPNRRLLRAMTRAYQWRARLETGAFRSIDALSRAEHVNATYVTRILPLAFLAPDLTEAILNGRQGIQLAIEKIRTKAIPVDWGNQRTMFST
jgi:hypothetical protein